MLLKPETEDCQPIIWHLKNTTPSTALQ